MNNLKKIKISISSLPQKGWWNNGIVAYHDNDMMSNGAIPNQDLIKKEQDKLTAILLKYSLDTVIIPFGKEIEINKLTKEVNEVKIKVEKSRDLYEKTLDKTTKSIEQFIASADTSLNKDI